MKLNYKILLIISLVFNLAFLGTLGYRMLTKRSHARDNTRSGRTHQTMQEWLSLEPEQEAEIQKIRDLYLPQYRALFDSINRLRELNTQVFTGGNQDTAVIFRHMDAIGKLQAGIDKLAMKQMLEESRVLNTEQREKFMNGVKERMERRSRPRRRPPEEEKDQRPPENRNENKIKKEEVQ